MIDGVTERFGWNGMVWCGVAWCLAQMGYWDSGTV
jgi:hypothetical protein